MFCYGQDAYGEPADPQRKLQPNVRIRPRGFHAIEIRHQAAAPFDVAAVAARAERAENLL